MLNAALGLCLSSLEERSSSFAAQASATDPSLLSRQRLEPKASDIYIYMFVLAGRLKLSCLVQNQTAFSASHVQADWAHLDHVVYKNEVTEHEI